MSHDKKKLDSMLAAKKISKAEHKALMRAIDKTWTLKSLFYGVMNPFEKVAGVKALFWGVFFLCLSSYLGVLGKLYFLGPLSLKTFLGSDALGLSFSSLLAQNLIGWLLLSIAFIGASKLLQKNQVRYIDFFGTVAFAHYP
jgi:hypothetical protein